MTHRDPHFMARLCFVLAAITAIALFVSLTVVNR